MKRVIRPIFFLLALSFCISPLNAADKNFVKGSFEMAGFLNTGFGWQKFAGGAPTEFASDGSYAGVLGSLLPAVTTGLPPFKGEDTIEAFVEVFELDMMAGIKDRVRFRADLLFGRAGSGSWVGIQGFDIEQAYVAWTLSKKHGIELLVGRMGTIIGFEAFEPYFNDTISWSIISRATLYPPIVTGARLAVPLSDNIGLYISAVQNVTNDFISKINDVPSGVVSLQINWGEEDNPESLVLSAYGGPESNSNKHFTIGFDATASIAPADNFKIGLEALYRRDNGNGGPNTDYVGALLNLHWDMTEKFYSYLRYSYARQFDIGNGVLNLTGAKQQIHEASIGTGYQIVDGMKFKTEARFDVVDPSGADTQWVPGVAVALACAF